MASAGLQVASYRLQEGAPDAPDVIPARAGIHNRRSSPTTSVRALKAPGPARKAPLLVILVSDTGISMNDEQLGRIFAEFQQAADTTARQYGGVGLGLSISKQLAQLLGGDLTATSQDGAGSTFILTLPLHYEI